MTTTANKRVSSLEAAGVRSSSSTTSSSLLSIVNKKKPVTTITPTSPTRTAKASNPPISSPVLSKRHTKTPLKKPTTVTTSNVTSPTTPIFNKKRLTTNNTIPSSPIPTVRSVSKASTLASSSLRASTPSSTSTTLLKRSKIPSRPVHASSSSDNATEIEDLKDKNKMMAAALSEKEEMLIEKDTLLQDMRQKLEDLEQQIKLVSKTTPANKEETLTPEIEIGVQQASMLQQQLQEQKELQQALLNKIEIIGAKLRELEQTLKKERTTFIQEQEVTEQKHRESFEKLREKLENEKSVLHLQVHDKERDIVKLQKDVDEMRDNIKDMHQSHQTRLTTFTNQLNLEHTNHIEQLKKDYESQLAKYCDSNEEDQSALKMELDNKAKEHVYMESKLKHHKELSKQEKEEMDQLLEMKVEELEQMQSEIVAKPKDENAEKEVTRKTELEQYEIKIRLLSEEIRQIKEEERKERTLIPANAIELAEHEILQKQLRESHEIERNNIIKRLDREYHKQLNKEIEKLTAKHQHETTEINQSWQNQLSELKKSYEIKEFEKNNKCDSLQQDNKFKAEIAKNEQSYNTLAVSLRNEHSETLEIEREKYQKLLAKYDIVNNDVNTKDCLLKEKEAELLIAVTELESKHNLVINTLESDYETIINNLKNRHANDLEQLEKNRAESESSLLRVHTTEIFRLQSCEQQLKDRLTKTVEHSEKIKSAAELKNTENLELAERTFNERYNSLEDEYMNNNIESLKSLYSEIEDVKQNNVRLQYEIKSLNVSNSQLKDRNTQGEMDSHKRLTMEMQKEISKLKETLEESNRISATKDKQLKEATAQLNTKADNEAATNDKIQIIIEQHQKELNILQHQFQNLLDMKDKELNDLSYKLKLKNRDSGSTATENFQPSNVEENEVEHELRKQVMSLEEDLTSKSLEMRWLESDSEQNETKLKEQGILIHHLQLNNTKLEKSIKALAEENDQMLRLIHHLHDF